MAAFGIERWAASVGSEETQCRNLCNAIADTTVISNLTGVGEASEDERVGEMSLSSRMVALCSLRERP